MGHSAGNAVRLVALTLIATVITQAIYVAALSDVGIVEGWPLRSSLWTVEVLAYALMAIAALTALAHDTSRPFIWSAIAISALLNTFQAGIGLSMFLPASEAGESLAPVLGTIVAGAFLFYFLAKVLIGFAAIGLGLVLWNGANMPLKALAALTGASGLAAAVVNIAALPQGTTLAFAAGAAGTAATLFAGIAAFLVARRSA